jgi:hypothetical protein
VAIANASPADANAAESCVFACTGGVIVANPFLTVSAEAPGTSG